MVEVFYNRDFTGSIVDDRTEMSQEERRFMKNAEVELKDGHYQISLPFKDRVARVPNNNSQALRRASSLKKKLERDPKLCADNKAFMGDIVAKGYARKVPPDQTSPEEGKAWYIPTTGYIILASLAKFELCSIALQSSKAYRSTVCCTKVQTSPIP